MQIIKRNGAETVVSDLTYDLRSGAPDFLDTHGRHHVRHDGVRCDHVSTSTA